MLKTLNQIEVVDEEKETANGNNPYDDILKLNEDIIFDCFNKVVGFDPNQIIRYSRGEVFPLWFNKHKMLINKPKFCENCKCEMIYEFQVINKYLFFQCLNL